MEKKTVQDGFSFDFPTAELLDLVKVSEQAWKVVRKVDGVRKTVNILAVLETFRTGVSRTEQEAVWQGNSEYHGLIDDHGEPRRVGGGKAVDLGTLLEEDLLSYEAGDKEGAKEKVQSARPSLFSAVGSEVPVFKKRYVELP